MIHPIEVSTAVNGQAERDVILRGDVVAKCHGSWVAHEKILAAWNEMMFGSADVKPAAASL